jgi:hypothetical protein
VLWTHTGVFAATTRPQYDRWGPVNHGLDENMLDPLRWRRENRKL